MTGDSRAALARAASRDVAPLIESNLRDPDPVVHDEVSVQLRAGGSQL